MTTHILKRLRLKQTAPAVVGAMIAAGGIAYAAIPDSGGVIKGCYATVNGQLRVLDSEANPAERCRPSETAIAWSKTGPQGPSGADGAAGPAGPAGPKGPAGLSGLQIVSSMSTVPGGAISIREATCPAGKTLIGGGAETAAGSLVGTNPSPYASTTTWQAQVSTIGMESGAGVYTYAFCAVVAP